MNTDDIVLVVSGVYITIWILFIAKLMIKSEDE
jgi:hypothetical protein